MNIYDILRFSEAENEDDVCEALVAVVDSLIHNDSLIREPVNFLSVSSAGDDTPVSSTHKRMSSSVQYKGAAFFGSGFSLLDEYDEA